MESRCLIFVLLSFAYSQGQISRGAYYGKNQQGGKATSTDDFQECYESCVQDQDCSSLDWDSANDKCYHHSKCAVRLTNLADTIHFQLSECFLGSNRAAPKPDAFRPDSSARTPPGSVLAPGDILEGGSNFADCLEWCLKNDACVGIDYNPNKRWCMTSQNIGSECNLQRSPGWTNYRFINCIKPDVVVQASTPTPCRNQAKQARTFDLVIVIDKSASICTSDATFRWVGNGLYTCDAWTKVNDFLLRVLNDLDIGSGEDEVQVAIVIYNQFAETVLGLSDNAGAIKSMIRQIQADAIPNSLTNTYAGIQEMRQAFRGNANRDWADDVAIILTDEIGNAGRQGEEYAAAEDAKADGINLITVGFGANVNDGHLQRLSSNPQELNNNYFTNPTSDLLQSKLKGYISGAVDCAPVVQSCETAQLDIVFVVDGSGSICNNEPVTCANWLLIVEFISDVAKQLSIGPSRTQIGLILYNDEVYYNWTLKAYQDRTSLLEAIEQLRFWYRGGPTNTRMAIEKADTFLFRQDQGDRAGAVNTLIIITDGNPNIDADKTIPTALEARDRNINILAVGITRAVDKSLLRDMSSKPQIEGENWFSAPDFDRLNNILDQVINRACNRVAAPTLPTISQPCETLNLDILFVLDGSGSVCNNVGRTCTNWEELINFIYRVVDNEKLVIGPSNSQVAVMIFSSTVQVIWHLDAYNEKMDLLDAIEGLKTQYPGGTTDIEAAIGAINTLVFRTDKDRLQAINLAVFITDGFSSDNSAASLAVVAERTINEGTEIVSIGITSSVNPVILRSISSQPQEENVNYYLAPNFGSLNFKLERITRQVCEEPIVPTPQPPTDECVVPFDIVFIVDGSGSLCLFDPTNVLSEPTCSFWQDVLEFIQQIINEFRLGDGDKDTRVGLVIFSTTARVIWELDRDQNTRDKRDSLTNLKNAYPGGTTNTADAFRKAIEVFALARTAAIKGIIFISDGRPNENIDAAEELADDLKDIVDTFITMAPNTPVDVKLRDFLIRISSGREEGDAAFTSMASSRVIDRFTIIKDDACEEDRPTPAPTTRPPTQSKCEGIDLAFVLDGSGSICDNDPTFNLNNRIYPCNDWNKMVDFVYELVDALIDGPNGDRLQVALSLFSNFAFPKFNFGDYTGDDLLRRIKALEDEYPAGNTNIYSGLKYMIDDVHGGPTARQGVVKITVVITDGDPTAFKTETGPEANRAEANGIKLYAVGVGNKVKADTLAKISSSPKRKGYNYFTTPNFQSLKNEIGQILGEIMADCVPQTTISTESPIRGGTTTTTESPMRELSTRRVTGTRRTTPRPTPRPIPTQGPVPQSCEMDVVFIVDSSGSICDNGVRIDDTKYWLGCDNWENIKQFMTYMVERMAFIGPDATRVSLVTFANNGKTIWSLDKYNSKSSLINALNTIKYDGGNTNTQAGLEAGRIELTGLSSRQGAQRVAIVVSDGIPTVQTDRTAARARDLINVADVFTLGVTNQINPDTIASFSSGSQVFNTNWFLADNFPEMQAAAERMFEVINPEECTTK